MPSRTTGSASGTDHMVEIVTLLEDPPGQRDEETAAPKMLGTPVLCRTPVRTGNGTHDGQSDSRPWPACIQMVGSPLETPQESLVSVRCWHRFPIGPPAVPLPRSPPSKPPQSTWPQRRSLLLGPARPRRRREIHPISRRRVFCHTLTAYSRHERNPARHRR